MFGPIRLFFMICFVGFGLYLGIKLEHARLSPGIDRICKSPNLRSELSRQEQQILCK